MKSHLIQTYSQAAEVNYSRGWNIYENGKNNKYPDVVEGLIGASATATQCAGLYEAFLTGDGFAAEIKEVDLSPTFHQVTLIKDLLDDVCHSLSRHCGAYIHVNYNALYQKENFTLLPYRNCRLGKIDDTGYITKAHYSPKGWDRDFKKSDVKIFDAFNPDPRVIEAQVQKAGGWHNYKGQIKFFSLQRHSVYPLSLIDTVALHADLENKMGMYYSSVVNRGFEDICYIRHREFDNPQDERKFYDDIKKLQGLENASSKLIVKDHWDSENPDGGIKIETITNNTNAEKYRHFEESAANYIRKAFKNIPPQLIDYVQGKLGNTSGEDLRAANAIYNAATAKDREKVERLFKELFTHFREEINPSGDWTIKQYSIGYDGTAH